MSKATQHSSTSRILDRLRAITPWLLALLLIAYPTYYFITKRHDQDFFSSTMSNVFATMIGLIMGIPIALQIARWQQRQEEASAEKAKAQEAASRKKTILVLIEDELNFNERMAETTTVNTESRTTLQEIVVFRTEFWTGLVTSGEVHWIDDLELRNKIIAAYSNIKILAAIHERYLITQTTSPHSGGDALTKLANRAVEYQYYIHDTITKARQAIYEQLQN